MVQVKEMFPRLSNGDIDKVTWISTFFSRYPENSQKVISNAYEVANIAYQEEATFYGQSCFEQALECAEILAELHADAMSVASALIYCTLQDSEILLEDIAEQLPEEVIKLTEGLTQMSAIAELQQQGNRATRHQVDSLRKMMLAMVSDVRIVMIVLAIRVCTMRGIQILGEEERHRYSQETMDMFAPLANRLGISPIKWELEDLAFHDLEPGIYKSIAKALNERRAERDSRIDDVILTLKEKLKEQSVTADITGRSKHIYSIHKKMQRKKVPFNEVYDTHAVRIIVDTTEHCYAALSLVHNLWQSIPEEFDDYINAPKPNGYQSIHTAVYGPDHKYLEVQIRTHKMHEENELGGAAHWLYKEGAQSAGGYEDKIAWLRELLDWHRELSNHDESMDGLHDRVFEDRVYVFTPNGDIIDLARHSTPLDFAYHVHSDVGHRCKGAKINGKLTPLTYQLQTGDRVEVTTSKEPKPSRDWLTPELGYLATAKARAKVHQWFKRQDSEKNATDGKHFLDKELQRLNITDINLDKVANALNTKNPEQLYISIACGNTKLTQVIQTIKALYPQIKLPETNQPKAPPKTTLVMPERSSGINVHGVSNLLTHLANCCKPIPGDPIIGYITMGKGVSIHHRECNNISQLNERGQSRLIEANWDNNQQQQYLVDLQISTTDSATTAPQVTALLANEKIKALHLNEHIGEKNNRDLIALSLQTSTTEELKKILNKLKQLAGVTDVKRTRYQGVDQHK